MRAKMVGASAFISKPIEADKVLDLAKDLITDKVESSQKHLMTNLDSKAYSNVARA